MTYSEWQRIPEPVKCYWRVYRAQEAVVANSKLAK